MPVKIIMLKIDGKKGTSTTPKLNIVKHLGNNKLVFGNTTSPYDNGKGYHEGPSVYLTPEIDEKVLKINKNIEMLKIDLEENISNSLGKIQSSIASIKNDILASKTFKERLKKEILEELKSS